MNRKIYHVQLLMSFLPFLGFLVVIQFLVDKSNENVQREMEISIKAGELVGILYDEILKQYRYPENPETLKSLNMLCVRLVFCLYAEDAGIFGGHTKFHDYIKLVADKDIKNVRRALIDLFKVLDTPEDKRYEIDPYMDETLASFPYVNGGLFAEENIEIPPFNEKIVRLLLEKASASFDWSEISPTIFGAVFESTLNPETRRSGGMHYTSIENIHKVIDPLFLEDLKRELAEIKEVKIEKTRNAKLEAYREKLAGLTFLDPACGSGNFLTETYISLRRLENEALALSLHGQMTMETGGVIKVSIGQFYGIEINDFAVTVAKTALWIAESQMMKETEEIVHANLDFLPLKSYANIMEGNALRIDWESVVPKDKLNYIMGNPPFVGNPVILDNFFQPQFGRGYNCAGAILILPISSEYAILLYDHKVYDILSEDLYITLNHSDTWSINRTLFFTLVKPYFVAKKSHCLKSKNILIQSSLIIHCVKFFPCLG